MKLQKAVREVSSVKGSSEMIHFIFSKSCEFVSQYSKEEFVSFMLETTKITSVVASALYDAIIITANMD